MKINIIAIGQRMPDWVNQGYKEYQQRMPALCALNLIELPLPLRTKNTAIPRVKEQEGESLLRHVPSNNRIITLDVVGKSLTSEQLALKLQNYYEDSQDISLLIGGPDGLSQACLSAADWSWSLSPLTLPHPLVRILLAEQLYRAWTLNSGHPYHR